MTDARGTPEGPVTEEADTPVRIDPQKVRVVDVEIKDTGELVRRDCYDPDGGPAEMGDVMRLKDDQLWLRVIRWAREKVHSSEVQVEWQATGLTPDEIGRIGVFTWPVGTAVRVFGGKKQSRG